MSIDQVIEMREKIVIPDLMSDLNSSIFQPHRLGIVDLLLIFSIVILIFIIIVSAFLSRSFYLCCGATIVLAVCLFFFLKPNVQIDNHAKEIAMEKYETEVVEWRIVANQYISSLPQEKREVVYIKIDPELGNNIRMWSSDASSAEIKRTPITASFKDGDHIVTETQWFETTMELTDEEKPYIEYQRLINNLGYGINAGIYNAKIHLPKSYSFTEIK
jgi:hypothetical protein